MRPLMTQCGDEHTELSACCIGSVSMGFMHATPGDMKSLRSSAERMALMVSGVWRGYSELGYCEGDQTKYRKTEHRSMQKRQIESKKEERRQILQSNNRPMRGERPRDISQSRMRRLSTSLHFQASKPPRPFGAPFRHAIPPHFTLHV
jgi:hypothetical protein